MNTKRLLQMETLEDRQLLTAVSYELTDVLVFNDDSQVCVQTEIPAISENNHSDCFVQMGELETTVAYNAHDFKAIQAFLEQKSGTQKNGTLLDSDVNKYDSQDPTTWTGVTWTEVEGELRAKTINWWLYSFRGEADFSGMTALESLLITDVYGEKGISSLDVSGCTSLQILSCWSNSNLTSLVFNDCPALTEIQCSSTGLTKLDVSACQSLKILNCSSNSLTELTLSSSIEELHCESNRLGTLVTTDCPNLKELYCDENSLTSLNLFGNPELTTLSCASNKGITELNLSGNRDLKELTCNNCAFTEIDLTPCKNLESLICWNSGLNSVITPTELINQLYVTLPDEKIWTISSSETEEFEDNFFKIEALPTYATSGTQKITFATVPVPEGYNEKDFLKLYEFLIQTDASGTSNGKKINPNFNARDVSTWTGVSWKEDSETTTVKIVDSIDWEGISFTGSADFSGLELTSLKISASSEETGKLESLNLTDCNALKTLACDYNPSISLDLTGCENLETFSCISSQMKELDLSARHLKELNLTGCTALETFNCNGNELKTLDLSTCTALTNLSCKENPLEELNLLSNTKLQTLVCGDSDLNRVEVSVEVRGKLTITLWSESETTWTLTDFFGEKLSMESANSFIISSFPCTATSCNQTILFSDPNKAPDGFCEEEYFALQEFLEKETKDGQKNGQLLNDSYDKDQPETWTGVTWSLSSGDERKVCKLCIQEAGLTGSLQKETFTECSCFAFGETEPETPAEIQSCISTEDSSFTDEEMPGNPEHVHEWNTLGVELWSEFLTASGQTIEITWDSKQFELDENGWNENQLIIHNNGVTITLLELESTDGRAVIKLSSGKGFTANEGNMLLGILKLKQKENIPSGYAQNAEIHVGNKTLGMQIWSVIYDLDDSNAVGIEDLVLFAKRYGSTDWQADFNCRNGVEISDLVLFAKHYTKKSTDQNQEIMYDSNYRPHEILNNETASESLQPLVMDYVWKNFFNDEAEDEEEEFPRVKKIAYL